MRWKINDSVDRNAVRTLQEQLQVNELIATLLVQRGIETFEQARAFFRPSLADLHDPYLMKDMDKAVQRIETALENDERILVFGDYDVDGNLDEFVSGRLMAEDLFTGNSFYIRDLKVNSDEWDSYSVGLRVDLDNDGVDELILNGPYGGMYLDSVGDRVVVEKSDAVLIPPLYVLCM